MRCDRPAARMSKAGRAGPQTLSLCSAWWHWALNASRLLGLRASGGQSFVNLLSISAYISIEEGSVSFWCFTTHARDAACLSMRRPKLIPRLVQLKAKRLRRFPLPARRREPWIHYQEIDFKILTRGVWERASKWHRHALWRAYKRFVLHGGAHNHGSEYLGTVEWVIGEIYSRMDALPYSVTIRQADGKMWIYMRSTGLYHPVRQLEADHDAEIALSYPARSEEFFDSNHFEFNSREMPAYNSQLAPPVSDKCFACGEPFDDEWTKRMLVIQCGHATTCESCLLRAGGAQCPICNASNVQCK